MDQAKKFLEKYVEWCALGLGAAFLFWMVYNNVIDKPVLAQVNSVPVPPGEVNSIIWNEKALPLQNAIKASTVISLPVPTYTASTDTISQLYNSDPLPANIVPITPADNGMDIKGPIITLANPVTSLPVIPAIVKLEISSGHSNIAGAVAPGAATDTKNIAMAIDKTWYTVGGVIPASDIAKAFEAVNIPKQFHNGSEVLKVILVRQERDSAGLWGPETDLPAMVVDAKTQLDPVPPVNAPLTDQKAYFDWAGKKETQIVLLQPPFYKVLQGDEWYAPGGKNPNIKVDVPVAVGPIDWKTWKGKVSDLTPEQRKDREKWLKDQAAARGCRGAAPPQYARRILGRYRNWYGHRHRHRHRGVQRWSQRRRRP